MKSLFLIIGVLTFLAGAVLALLSLGVLQMDAFSGHKKYLIAGAILVALGIVLFLLAGKKKKS